MSVDTVLAPQKSLAPRSAARLCILTLVVAGLQFSASHVFAQQSATQSAKQCTNSGAEVSNLIIACLQSIPTPTRQPEYISQEQWEYYIAEEERKGQEALKKIREELIAREREAWFKKFHEENFQKWWDEAGKYQVDIRKNQWARDAGYSAITDGDGVISAWYYYSHDVADDSFRGQDFINALVGRFITEAWNAYAEPLFQKYIDDLMREAVKAENDRIAALKQKHRDTMVSLYGAFYRAFNNCFDKAQDLINPLYKTCTEGFGYGKGVGMYCAGVNLSVAACKSTCIRNSEYPGEIVHTESASCDRCRWMDKPMCWPASATVPMVKRTSPCPEASQAAKLCTNSCEGMDETKAAECRANCAKIFATLWEMCAATSASLPASPTPANGSQKQQGDRTGSKLRAPSSSTKAFGIEKEKTNAKTTATRKNNLDRHDLGPTFASPGATTSSPSGSKATQRGGSSTTSTTKTWAPSGAATGGTTTWAPAGAKQ